MTEPRAFGPYQIVRRLGGGGMGETFLAVRRGPGGFEQRVCLKRVLPGRSTEETFVELFLEEARIAASLRHSNIVGVIDFGAAPEGYFMALELVDGADLAGIVHTTGRRGLPPPLVALIGADLAAALDYAHNRTRAGLPHGIVHRDISSSNVLVSYSGEVKLADFGLAKVMSGDDASSTGIVKGKVPYMSPEQARAEAMDGRSDLFSLGIVLYEALAGVRPFDGATVGETIGRLLNGRRRPIAELAPEAQGALCVVIEKLLEIEPAKRFASAAELLDALTACLPPVTARRELGSLAERARPKRTLVAAELQIDSAALVPTVVRPRATRRWLLTVGALLLVLVGLSVLAARALMLRTAAPLAGPMPLGAVGPAEPRPVRPPVPVVVPAVPAEPPANEQPPAEPPPAEQPERAPVSIARATVSIAVIPWGKVWIDGRLLGPAPVSAMLGPGRHVIRVGAGETPTQTTTVSVTAGERRQMSIRLR